MKKSDKAASQALVSKIANPRSGEIDELYGLEPVYEPGQGGPPGLRPDEFVSIQCPWCSERLEVHVDLTAGPRTYIEDCQVCCRAMELSIETTDSGALDTVKVQRTD